MMTSDSTPQDTPPQDTRTLPPLDALAMALNMAAQVEAISEYVSRGPDEELQGVARGLGGKQQALARTAAYVAMVSVAQDVRRIADAITEHRWPVPKDEVPW